MTHRTCVAIAMTLLLPLSAAFGAERPDRPNIIVLLADDLGYGELRPGGPPERPHINTPHIDSLAQSGIRFTNGYVSASYCAPSRAGLMTGRYQTRFGFEENPVGAQNEEPGVGLPPSQRTMAEHLQSAGYATALIGKWHLGGSAPYHPQRHGFDYFFGFLHEGHYFKPYPYGGMVSWLRVEALPNGERSGRWRDGNLVLSAHMPFPEPDYDANNPIYRNGQPVREPQYLTDAFTREAVEFIELHRDRPFFLSLTYNAVHSPLQALKSDMAPFEEMEDVQRRIFAGMLKSMDDSVGRIMAKLRALDLEEDTLIFFLSDNGGPTRELTSSNAPLRGDKGTLWEGGIRVPFMVQWKGRLPEGEVYEKPVISLDIFPTAAAAAGIEIPENLDGVNLLPYLTGERRNSPQRALYWRMGDRMALREGDWKIVHHGRRNAEGEWELYNLAEDLSEQNDLSTAEPRKRRALKDRWNELNAQMAQPLF